MFTCVRICLHIYTCIYVNNKNIKTYKYIYIYTYVQSYKCIYIRLLYIRGPPAPFLLGHDLEFAQEWLRDGENGSEWLM